MDIQSKIYAARSKLARSTRHGHTEASQEAREELTEALLEQFLDKHHDNLKDVGILRVTEIIKQYI